MRRCAERELNRPTRRFFDTDERFINDEKIVRPVRMANTVVDRECLQPGWDDGWRSALDSNVDGGPLFVSDRRRLEIKSFKKTCNPLGCPIVLRFNAKRTSSDGVIADERGWRCCLNERSEHVDRPTLSAESRAVRRTRLRWSVLGER